MAQLKAKLYDEILIPAPFDLLFCGHRETYKESGRLKLTASDPNPHLLADKAMRFFVGDRLVYQGHVRGDDEFGQLRKTEAGKFEVWLDPRYVNYA
jgi:hypothetical protein